MTNDRPFEPEMQALRRVFGFKIKTMGFADVCSAGEADPSVNNKYLPVVSKIGKTAEKKTHSEEENQPC